MDIIKYYLLPNSIELKVCKQKYIRVCITFLLIEVLQFYFLLHRHFVSKIKLHKYVHGCNYFCMQNLNAVKFVNK